MGSLSQAKTLGGIGSILILLTAVPYAGSVLGVVGFVLILIAVKYISDSLQDRSVFNNMLIAVILGIVGTVIGGLVVIGSVFRYIGFSNLTRTTPPAIAPSNVVSLVAGILVGLVVIWIVFIISAYFLRKSYNTVAARLNVGMFRTAALLYFIGAILVIILVGFALILVAQILFIVAFFSIPETPLTGGPTPPPPMQPGGPTQTTKFCVKCGASLSSDATFCSQCGASQPAR